MSLRSFLGWCACVWGESDPNMHVLRSAPTGHFTMAMNEQEPKWFCSCSCSRNTKCSHFGFEHLLTVALKSCLNVAWRQNVEIFCKMCNCSRTFRHNVTARPLTGFSHCLKVCSCWARKWITSSHDCESVVVCDPYPTVLFLSKADSSRYFSVVCLQADNWSSFLVVNT